MGVHPEANTYLATGKVNVDTMAGCADVFVIIASDSRGRSGVTTDDMYEIKRMGFRIVKEPHVGSFGVPTLY